MSFLSTRWLDCLKTSPIVRGDAYNVVPRKNNIHCFLMHFPMNWNNMDQTQGVSLDPQTLQAYIFKIWSNWSNTWECKRYRTALISLLFFLGVDGWVSKFYNIFCFIYGRFLEFRKVIHGIRFSSYVVP